MAGNNNFYEQNISEQESTPEITEATEAKSASGYTKSDYTKAVVGMTTGDGVEIEKCSTHAFDRVIERDIWPQSVTSALKEKSVPAKNGNAEYISKGTHVYVDNKTGTIISSIYKGKGKRK